MSHSVNKAFLDVLRAAKLLGLSKKAIRRLVACRKIPFLKPPGVLRVSASLLTSGFQRKVNDHAAES